MSVQIGPCCRKWCDLVVQIGSKLGVTFTLDLQKGVPSRILWAVLCEIRFVKSLPPEWTEGDQQRTNKVQKLRKSRETWIKRNSVQFRKTFFGSTWPPSLRQTWKNPWKSYLRLIFHPKIWSFWFLIDFSLFSSRYNSTNTFDLGEWFLANLNQNLKNWTKFRYFRWPNFA